MTADYHVIKLTIKQYDMSLLKEIRLGEVLRHRKMARLKTEVFY